MKVEPLALFEQYCRPSEGYLNTLLYHSDWRLDYVWDVRMKKKPYYSFVFFGDKSVAQENVSLVRDEVYGFLKGRFPKLDTRKEIKESVIKQLFGEF